MRILPWLYALPPDLLRWFLLILTAAVMAWAGRGIYLARLRGLRHGTTNMNTLVSLGTGVAFAYSAYATIWPAGRPQVYFDAVLLIIGFLLLGKALEARAKRSALAASTRSPGCAPPRRGASAMAYKTRSARRDSAGRGAYWCCLESAFRWTQRSPEGRTTVDESMLTGEPDPRISARRADACWPGH